MLSALSPVSAPEEHSCHNTSGKGSGSRRREREREREPGSQCCPWSVGVSSRPLGGKANNPELQSGGTRTRRLSAHSRGSSYALRITHTHTYLHIKHSAAWHTTHTHTRTHVLLIDLSVVGFWFIWQHKQFQNLHFSKTKWE